MKSKFKFKRIIAVLVAVFWCIAAEAKDDRYLDQLEKTVADVNASLNATLKQLKHAVDSGPAEELPVTPEAVVAENVEPEIIQAVFTTGIRDNEPVNVLEALNEPTNHLYFYTELAGMGDRHLLHRWYYRDSEVAVQAVNPRRQYWQAFSRMELEGREGLWVAELVDEDGVVLQRRELDYTKSQAAVDTP
jgi:hypothetical protein